MATVEQRSAGGVVYRRRGRGAQVVLVATAGKDGLRWGLPKGRIGRKESAREAARREVREETGLEAEIERPLKTIGYWYYWRRGGTNLRHHKRVDFFLMRAGRGHLDEHDAEVLEARWFPLSGVVEAASYPSEREVLESAVKWIRRRTREAGA